MPIALATDSGATGGNPVNDCYGTTTAAANTAFTRGVPPRSGTRAKIFWALYECGTTVHTLSIMTALDEKEAASEAASGQGVINLNLPISNPDGTALETSDWLYVEHEDGTYGAYSYSSGSLALTVSPVLTKKVLKGARIFYMGKPADHDRQFRMKASSHTPLGAGGDDRNVVATAAQDDSPLLVHSDNPTAQGWLTALGFGYTFGA